MSPRCPFCLEDIAPASVICGWCQEPLTAEAESAPVADWVIEQERDLKRADSYANSAMLGGLCGGLCCPIFILLTIAYGWVAIRLYRKHNHEPRLRAQIGLWLGVLWAVVFVLWWAGMA